MGRGTSLDDATLSAEVELRRAERDEERAKVKVEIAKKKVIQRTDQVRAATSAANSANSALRHAENLRDIDEDARKRKEAEARAEQIEPVKIEADRYKDLLKTTNQELQRKKKSQKSEQKADSSRKNAFERAEKRKNNEANKMIRIGKRNAAKGRQEAEKTLRDEKKRIFAEFNEQKKLDTKISKAAAKSAAQDASLNKTDPGTAYRDTYDNMMDELEDARELDETDQLEDADKDYKQKLEDIKEEEEVIALRAQELKDEAAQEVADAREDFRIDQESKADEYYEQGEEIKRLEKEYKELKEEASIVFKELNALVKIDKKANKEYSRDRSDLKKYENKANKCARAEKSARSKCEAAHAHTDKCERDVEAARDNVEIKRRTYQSTLTSNPLTPVRSR